MRTIPCEDGRVVFLSLLFHDAIYVAGRKDNESRSADLAVSTLRQHSNVPDAQLSFVREIILATAHHVAAASASRDLKVALDIDMSILGSAPAEYARYASDVAKEYCPSVTSAQKFAAGRIAFLKQVLAQSRIFHLPETVEKWELPARMNIAREIEGMRELQGWFWRLITMLLTRKGELP
ncbi:hypothetical protein BWI17_21360 [Betaproteobacteria bacterium GR16-43]|nr:hypothetical protein BWI17_21360 [Betaproteobacteria bacterium GR16-43]